MEILNSMFITLLKKQENFGFYKWVVQNEGFNRN